MSNPRNLSCSNCSQSLRAITLPGHYLTEVEIDLCDNCCLIWFDPIESARIAGPGIAELIGVIHKAMSSGHNHPGAAALARVQHCPICAGTLKQVFNVSRFGRTRLLQCPHGHGYYQTYMLYLAEKGYVRPMLWADVSQMTASGRELFCANCGAGLEARPQEACPYCQSAIGVLDPARLASAIDVKLHAKAKPPIPSKHEQTACASCGGALDASRHVHCPHCHAVIRRRDMASALKATAAVIDAVRHRYDRQRPTLPRRKRGQDEQARPMDPEIKIKIKAAFVLALVVFMVLFAVIGG